MTFAGRFWKILITTTSAMLFASCEDASVKTDFMSSAMFRAPVVTTVNPFTQMNKSTSGGNGNGYIEIGGSCDTVVTGFEVSFDGVYWDRVPSTTDYDPGNTGTTVTFNNDLNCQDKNFYFIGTEAVFPHIPTSGDLSFILVRGLTSFGPTINVSFFPPPQPEQRQPYCFDGPVNAIKTLSDRVLFGGAFNSVGPCNGGAHMLTKGAVALAANDTYFDGSIRDSAADALGGVFVAGGFYRVGNSDKVRKLVRIGTDGSIQGWKDLKFLVSGSEDNSAVKAVTVGAAEASGKYPIYVGGKFDQVSMGGTVLDVTNLVKLLWSPIDNSLIIDTTFATATVLSNSVTYDGKLLDTVVKLRLGDGTNAGAYLFAIARSTAATQITSVKLTTGLATSSISLSTGTVNDLAVSGDMLYIGGFNLSLTTSSTVLGQYAVATSGALSAQDTALTSFAFSSGVASMKQINVLKTRVVSGVTYLYVGGNFMANVTQPSTATVFGLLKFNLSTSAAIAIDQLSAYMMNGSAFRVVTALDFDSTTVEAAVSEFPSLATVSGVYVPHYVARSDGASVGTSLAVNQPIMTLTSVPSRTFFGGVFNSYGITKARRLMSGTRTGQILAVGDAATYPTMTVTGIEVVGADVFMYSDGSSLTQNLYMADLGTLALKSASSYALVQGGIAKHLIYNNSLVLIGTQNIKVASTSVGTLASVSLSNYTQATPTLGTGSEVTGVQANVFVLGGNLYGAGVAATSQSAITCLSCPSTSVGASVFLNRTISQLDLLEGKLFVTSYLTSSGASASQFQVFRVSASNAWEADSSAFALVSSGSTYVKDVCRFFGYTMVNGGFTSFNGDSDKVYGVYTLTPAYARYDIKNISGSATRSVMDTTQANVLWRTRYGYGDNDSVSVANLVYNAQVAEFFTLPAEYF